MSDSLSSLDSLVSLSVLVSSVALVFNSLLLFILARYAIIHDHLRSALTQAQLSLQFANIFVFLRGLVFLTSSSENGPLCPSTYTPTLFMGFFIFFSVAICLERCYASYSYHNYEKTEKLNALKRITVITWSIYVVLLLSHFPLSFLLLFSPLPCPFPHPSLPFVSSSNLPILIYLLFFLGLASVYQFSLKNNKQNLIEYINKDYNSLSSRFQLQENVTCIRRLKMQNLFLIGLCVFMLTYHHNTMKMDDSFKELQYLFCPISSLFISCNFLFYHDSIKRKAYNLYRDAKDLCSRYWIVSFPSSKDSDSLLPLHSPLHTP